MKKPSKRLKLVLDYGQQAQHFLAGKSLNEWRSDIQLRYAVSHALANIAENVKGYIQSVGSQALIDTYPHVQWNQIARFRDKMIHHYQGIDQDLLYEFATGDLEGLLAAVRIMLGAPNGHGDN